MVPLFEFPCLGIGDSNYQSTDKYDDYTKRVFSSNSLIGGAVTFKVRNPTSSTDPEKNY